MKYRAEIDGLRALAVIPVILFHAGFEMFSGGYVGVDIFFVISGYLIATIIISEMAEENFSIINFYERRARRILPALFVVMIVCIPFAWFWMTPNELKDFGESLLAVSFFTSNILFWRESGYFEIAAELKPLLHTWSLAIEEQFYILFPIFLLLTWRIGLRWVVALLLLVLIISLGVAQWGAYNSPTANFYLLPTRGWELLIGVLLAFHLRYSSYIMPQSINQTLSLLGFGMIVYSIISFDKTTPFPGLYSLIPTIGTGLLILFTVPKTLIYSLLNLKPIVGVGLISYSAYLWHQPLLAFTKLNFPEDHSNILLIGICSSSLVIAYFSWRYIENPFRQKKIMNRSFIFSISITAMLLLSTIGQWLNYSNGALKYYPLEKQKVYKNFINPSEYVVKRHKEISLKEFSKENSKNDIIIIGDSHSQDLVNAVFEADLNQKYEFSSFEIPIGCGVLFIKDRSDREDPVLNCQKKSFYNKDLLKQISLADEVWIVSNWKDADINYMTESLKNLLVVNDQIKLFGSKNMGIVNARWYKNNDLNDWSSPILNEKNKKIFNRTAKINESINQISKLMGVEFINTQHLICNGNDFCANYRAGNIISYDDSHLTKHGAKILGKSIKLKLQLNK